MEYKNIDKLMDIATSNEKHLTWPFLVNDLVSQKEKDLTKILSALTFEQLNTLSYSVNEALIMARKGALSNMANLLEALNPSVDEMVNLFGSKLRELSPAKAPTSRVLTDEKVINDSDGFKATPINENPITVAAPIDKKEVGRLKRIRDQYKERVTNGQLANPEEKSSSKRYFTSIHPFASDDARLRNRYVSYLAQRDPESDPYTIGNEVLKYFSAFYPQRVYGVRNEIKHGKAIAVTTNPLTKEIKKAYKKGLVAVDEVKENPTPDANTAKRSGRESVGSFSDLNKLQVETKPYEQVQLEKKLSDDYIDEELLAELDNQLNYL